MKSGVESAWVMITVRVPVFVRQFSSNGGSRGVVEFTGRPFGIGEEGLLQEHDNHMTLRYCEAMKKPLVLAFLRGIHCVIRGDEILSGHWTN